jgi:Leucine Rich repeat
MLLLTWKKMALLVVECKNMPQLQRLTLHGCALRVDGVRSFQPALRTNRTLKQLNLCWCGIGDEGIRLITNALVVNAIMERLNICKNRITAAGLNRVDATQHD